MAASLRDQMLQAGLVTEEQVNKAENEKKKKYYPKKKAQSNTRNTTKSTTKSTTKNHTNNPSNQKKKKKPQSDLASFYQQRARQERKEKQEDEKQKQEAARIKKERRQKVGKLIKENALKEEEGEVRYNFVVGTSIKYLFVTEAQQQQLSEGILAITFLGGKKRLIPVETGKKILEIDPDKIVILSE